MRYEKVVENGQLTIKEIHKIVVFKFSVDNIDDPDLYAAEPLSKWEHSEQGQFVMKNAVQRPIWQKFSSPLTFNTNYAVVAELEKSKLAEYYLRWNKP